MRVFSICEPRFPHSLHVSVDPLDFIGRLSASEELTPGKQPHEMDAGSSSCDLGRLPTQDAACARTSSFMEEAAPAWMFVFS